MGVYSKVKRLLRISIRRVTKRVAHPIVFQTPIVFPVLNFFRLSLSRALLRSGQLGNFHRIPVQLRHEWWGRLLPSVDPCDFPLQLPARDEILQECSEIRAHTGAWPISFSSPKGFANRHQLADVESRKPKSVIIPGLPYTFDSEKEYLGEYGSSQFALTHKKGGWDCFRHIEIFECGAIPIMPDIQNVPMHTMVHYPKVAMHQMVQFLPALRAPQETSHEALGDFLEANLSSQAMAYYLMSSMKIEPHHRVLFVDEALTTKADYQSVFTLIGLKQVLGDQVRSLFNIPYIYEDFELGSMRLYGRGFGYSRVLPAHLSDSGSDGSNLPLEELHERFDFMVVGSIQRNLNLARKLLKFFDPHRTAWVHGEDRGPGRGEISEFRNLGVELFVRELA